MKLLSLFLFLFSLVLCGLSFPVNALDSENAKSWLERLSRALRQLNFSTSFVVVKNNQAEPYHWLHGVNSQNEELEILTRLNGPRKDVLRKGTLVNYRDPDLAEYSVTSKSIIGPIPAIFSGKISELEDNYRFISVGRGRVLDRAAQVIRVVAKDAHRYGYWLWLDQESALLLKMAITTRKGQLLEQVQFTHLDITEKLPDNLVKLQSAELPKEIDLQNKSQNTALSWKINWLPVGFEQVKANRHRIRSNKKAVEFMLFSDGLIDVSVYVNASHHKQRAVEYASYGATLVLNQVVNGNEVSVVGKITPNTAKRIAESIGPASSVNSLID